MYEVAGEELQTVAMDHHGLVAAVCKDLKIAERIDERLGPFDDRRVVSPGKAVVAMILNGLGFTNRRLYLTHQFFENKPVETLLGNGIKAEDITDYTLGHTLDEIFNYGASELFGSVAFDIALSEDLLGAVSHLDTTSFSVTGEYDREPDVDVIKITHGYSKDHRPDLKQVVLSLVVNGPSSIPLWMEPLDGNSSDKKSFHETVEKVRNFQSQIGIEKDSRWIGDSALYTKDKLLKENGYLWVTRVPEVIKEVRDLVKKDESEFDWELHSKGYKTTSVDSNYGGIAQRWIIVYSEQAYKRERKTLERRLDKQSKALEKVIWHLGNEIFNCEADAKSAIKKAEKQHRFFKFDYEIVAVERHTKAGRPSAGDKKSIVGYQIKGKPIRDEALISEKLNAKGRFIIATNDLDKATYPDKNILDEYKEQQDVEGGFRFLKDPWFMLDSIFLKKAERIEGLMMVMTLCLLVYNVAQYKLRKKLEEEKETLPNQLGKKVKNPTMRWVFQLMEGISAVRFYKDKIADPTKEVITNLTTLREKIIRFFGETACRLYGLIPNNQVEVLGM